MKVSKLREIAKHAQHMVDIRPDGKDKEVAEALIALADPILKDMEDQEIEFRYVGRDY